MSNRLESEYPSFVEKSLWWAKIGGIVAAVIGVIGSNAELVFGGAGVAAVSQLVGTEIFRYRKTTPELSRSTSGK